MWFSKICVSIIADLVKKMEEQKVEADRHMKVLSRQVKVRKLYYVAPFITSVVT